MYRLLNYQKTRRLMRVYGRSLVRYATPTKIVNALRTEWAYRRRVSDVKSWPYILFLEPLYYCNLDCPLCDRQVFPGARKNDAGKLSLETFDRILDECGDYLFQVQIFGQGEPLLDWERTREIVRRSHARKIFTLISTNCTLVTQQIADEMMTSGLDHLVCAIDGISQESYERYRTGGRIEDAMEGLRLFAEARDRHRAKMEIEWQFLVHRYNRHEVEAAKKIAEKRGLFIRFAPLRGMEFNPELRKYWLSDDYADFHDRDLEMGKTVYDYPCYFLWRSLVLNSNEKMARCLIYQNVSEYGSLKDHSVRALYNHPSTQRARELFKPGAVADGAFPQPCNNCSYFHRHHGGVNMTKSESLREPQLIELGIGNGITTKSQRHKEENSREENFLVS